MPVYVYVHTRFTYYVVVVTASYISGKIISYNAMPYLKLFSCKYCVYKKGTYIYIYCDLPALRACVRKPFLGRRMLLID